ncbi:MAG: exodeoxyribonuclease VII large subunit, partial [Bacillota bacterium]|nr:exodeoxyribonuclease VII large subunit [Bacillota bacterium]
MQPDGIGALYVAFNQLKEKLEKEGLFDPRHKKPLPKIPLRVGVITSPTGAAVRDIINVMERRFPLAGIYIYPALVQGDGAAAQLIDAIKFFNREKKADVLILGRGGGSIEDLWAFNDEGLARAIYDSEIPVISAVGHETDFTIADFAADMRAPTPSAAAELCVPDSTALTHSFENLKQRIFLLTYNELKQKKKLVDMLKNSRVLTSPTQYLDERRMSLIYFSKSLENSAMTILMKKRHSLSCLGAKMDSLSPLAVLSRGYSFAEGSHGILKTVSDVERGDSISVRLSDGRVSASVTDIIFDEKQGESFHGE